jgi:hypothetical protein
MGDDASISVSGDAEQGYELTFTDEVTRSFIEEAWQEISARGRIRSLELEQAGRMDLARLSDLEQLERLVLPNADLLVLPLNRLRQLRQLDLSYSQVEDLGPLAELTKLRGLELRQTKVGDVSPLVALQQLEMLDVSSTPVVMLSPVADLPVLTTLLLDDIHVDPPSLQRRLQCPAPAGPDGKTPNQVVAERLAVTGTVRRIRPSGQAGQQDITKARLIIETAKEVSQPDS